MKKRKFSSFISTAIHTTPLFTSETVSFFRPNRWLPYVFWGISSFEVHQKQYEFSFVEYRCFVLEWTNFSIIPFPSVGETVFCFETLPERVRHPHYHLPTRPVGLDSLGGTGSGSGCPVLSVGLDRPTERYLRSVIRWYCTTRCVSLFL